MNIQSGKLACNNIFKGVPIKQSSYITLRKNKVKLITKNYHKSIECDESKNQYKINPFKFHDAMLIYKYDKPFTVNLKIHEQEILNKIKKFFSNKKFNINKFYKHFKVDLPNKYINHFKLL